MVNWHLFDVEDVELTGHTGVFGENRSGKSTILDMAQVVLTGGNRNVQRLNAVAGDKGKSRSASKRSVVDYCLGTLGEDQRKREQARTYICLGFVDREGGSFFQEWSALFVMDGVQGDRVIYHYPRLQAAKGATEEAAVLSGALQSWRLSGFFRALPVADANDGEPVVCFRTYLPAAMREV